MASGEAAAQALPDGVHHYDNAKQVPVKLSKYWRQRYEIFSKYDEGVWITDDAWFGVTPEPVANKIADHVATASKDKTVMIDCFAGAGGNTIAFALSGRWNQIFAVEKDEKTLACAKHNAEVYGVSKKIFWIHGDIFQVLQTRLKAALKKAVVFGSPPWGGPTYINYGIFDVEMMHPYSMKALYGSFAATATHVVLFLPRSSDLKQIAKYARKDEKLKVTHYCMHSFSKALCVFFGQFETK